MTKEYIFTSKRLGFRNWRETDVKDFQSMNSDSEVMAYFPNTLTGKESTELVQKLKLHYTKYKYTYFVTETLAHKEFIGFIGFAFQEYKTDFTPAVDIGWRLKKNAWGKGYATEGAKKCLEVGFEKFNFNEIISTCTVENIRSEKVMKKLGMMKIGTFNHPQLKKHPQYEKCVCYRINKNAWTG